MKTPKLENYKNWKTQQLNSPKAQTLHKLDNSKPRARKLNTSTIQKLENTKL